MKILILTDEEIRRLLPMDVCVELMAGALASLARGEVHQPLRTIVRPAKAAGILGLMPAYRSGPGGAVYGLKTIGVPGNPARGLDAHQGSVLLFDGENGRTLALMNASAITAIRTAAVSGVATRLLAGAEAGDLAILGSGVQARSHLAAMACVRRLRRVRVASRNLEHARRLAVEAASRNTCPVEAVPDAETALRGADLVVTATSAARPVVKRAWIAAGAHLNAVGASTPAARELDAATMAAARLFVDRRESALAEAGDYLQAVEEGAIGPDHIQAEVGEVLVGAHPGRRAPDEITVFKSLGLAVEDLAAAEFLYKEARERSVGSWAPF